MILIYGRRHDALLREQKHHHGHQFFLVLASWLLGSAKFACLQRQKPAMFAQMPVCVYRHFTGAVCTTSSDDRFAAFSLASGLSKSSGHLEKLLPLAIADSSGVNVNESERERSGIIRGQFYGVWRGGAIFRGAHKYNEQCQSTLLPCRHRPAPIPPLQTICATSFIRRIHRVPRLGHLLARMLNQSV